MNERIKELILEAGFPKFDQMYVVSDGEELERFAKLIVEECCNWINGSPSTDAGQLLLTKSFIISGLKGYLGYLKGEVKMNEVDMSDTGRVEQREIEMSNETCPHCGAAGEMNQAHSQVDYDCGSYKYVRSPVTDPDVDDEWTGKLFRLYACYERQLAQKDAEIEKLKQAVLDEREACAKVCDDDLKIKLATAIRARGEVK